MSSSDRRAEVTTELKRPPSVTVIGWLIVAGSALALVWSPLAYPVPELRQAVEETGWGLAEAVVWSVAGGVIGVASGLAMLKGLNWGRWLYLVYVPLSFLLLWLLEGFDPLWLASTPLYLVILVLLTRPAAAEFFAGEPATRPGLVEARPVVAVRRVASVILLALGAFYAPVALMLSAVFLSAGLFDLQVVGLFAIALAVASALIVAGVALWGWDRWRIVLGVELTVAGGFSALVAGALPLMMRSPQWQAAEAPDGAFVYRIVLGYAVAALLLAGAGIPLIIAQRRRDRGAE